MLKKCFISLVLLMIFISLIAVYKTLSDFSNEMDISMETEIVLYKEYYPIIETCQNENTETVNLPKQLEKFFWIKQCKISYMKGLCYVPKEISEERTKSVVCEVPFTCIDETRYLNFFFKQSDKTLYLVEEKKYAK